MRYGTKSRWVLAAILYFALIVVVGSVTAPLPASAETRATVTPISDYLVKIEYQGGMCGGSRGCYSSVSMFRDGSVVKSVDVTLVTTGFYGQGELDAVTVEMLATLIETSDFAALRAVKYTYAIGTMDRCAFASNDGSSATIYTFYRTNGTEVISDCDYVIDHENPLFKALDAALQRADTVITPIVTSTPLPPITPTTVATPLLEALRRKLATGWNCFQSTVAYKGSRYTFNCHIAAGTSVTIYLEQFDTEADAQRAFPIIPDAVLTTFHGFPAATGVSLKTDSETTEYVIIQARRILVKIDSHFEYVYGLHAIDAAESLYWAALDLGLVDFQPSGTSLP